jgi:hypothetical protein
MSTHGTWHDVKEPTLRPASSAAGEPSRSSQAAANAIEYPDLGSRVHLGHVPRSLTDALPRLYSSVFCLVEYIELFDRPTNLNVCVLDHPPHIVCFSVCGRDAVILNRVFDIDGTAARRVCESIFRALPKIRRVCVRHFKLDPADIGLPFRTVATGDDLVLSLPSSLEEYKRGVVGRKTRKQLRNYMNRLSRELPGFTFELREKAAIDNELVSQVVAFNRVRMIVKGTTSEIDEAYEQRLQKVLAGYGFAGILRAEGEVVAGELCTKVGASYYVHAGAFDQTYAELHLGLLCAYLTVCAAIERGGLEYHLLWGNSLHKRQLGCRPLPLYAASLYRTRIARALAMSELSQLASRRVALVTRRILGRLRHAAGEIRRVGN